MVQPSSLHPTTRRWRGTRSIAYTPGSIAQVGSVRTPNGETREEAYTADRETHRTPGGAFHEFSYFGHSRHVMTMPI